MIKKTLFSLALASFLFVSCKKNEEKVDRNNFLGNRSELLKRFKQETAKPRPNPNGEYGEMTFTKTEHDFGTITQGDKVSTEFEFTNTGKFALNIYEAKGSCGCTVPEYPKTPIKPGEKGLIKVSFNSAGKMGKQNKSVFLATNTKIGNETLKITADIKEK